MHVVHQSPLHRLQRAPRYAVRSRPLMGLGACQCATLGDITPEARLRGEQAIAATRAAYKASTLKGYRFGSLGASSIVGGAAQGASTGAAVGGVYGAAIGAVVGAVGGLFSKKKDPNAAEKWALSGQLDKYMQTMGSIPGRAYDINVLKQLVDAAGYRGMWPNTKWSGGAAIEGAIDGCKKCTPPTIREFVRDQVSQGDIDPRSLATKFTAHVKQTWGDKWFVEDAGPTQKQLMIDIMDFFIPQYKQNAPLFYAPEWTVAANTPPASTAPAPAPIPLPAPTMSTPTVSTPVPAPVANQPTIIVQPPQVTSADDPKLQAYINALMQQGANQQQAFTAALSALGNSGVAVTPQAQQAVASDVQQAGAGQGLPQWVLYVAGAVALTFALARPGKRGNAS